MTLRAGRKVTEVAVGVVLRADGAVLLADRPAGKPYPGYWEFPGGKLEPGEDVAKALARELHEELGIEVEASVPWVTFEYSYPHAYVRLHFERVYAWHGTPHAREGQQLGFFRPAEKIPGPLLPAAVPALRWLQLPDVLAFDGRASRFAPVLGIEQLRSGAVRPAHEWAGAFVEQPQDLVLAADLQCDFALLGPIRDDPREPGRAALGWLGFATLAKDTPLPLYAFGGVTLADLEEARTHGAHGLALSVTAA